MSDVERLVLTRLRAGGATTRRPSHHFPDLTIEEPTDLIAGIVAARRFTYEAQAIMRDYATKARGRGTRWADLADPLGVVVDKANYQSPGEAAFKWCAGKPSMPFDPVYVGWRCESCDQMVVDSGPFNGHPTDDEKGHAADCERHLAEIATYMFEQELD